IESTAEKRCDTSDMVIVHRMFRRECALLPRLVSTVASGDVVRAETVAAYAREVLDMLHHHHEGEDELLWPKLSARARFDDDQLVRMDRQHDVIAALLDHAGAALAEWGHAPNAHTTARLAAILEETSSRLDEHLGEEEAVILPVVERVISEGEWQEVGRRGFASIPKKRRLVVLGYLLENASPHEQAGFLAAIPSPARLAYRVIGRRQHRRESSDLRGPLQARAG
ncbi:MAG: hemerythrin cation binding domain protein, partial [Mycobacterium sp.]|nr:hemerythrin cation binding domain protein [Mycobacterium sp.]